MVQGVKGTRRPVQDGAVKKLHQRPETFRGRGFEFGVFDNRKLKLKLKLKRELKTET